MLSLKRNVNCPRRMAVYAVFDVLDRMGCQYEQALVGDIKAEAKVLGHTSEYAFAVTEQTINKRPERGGKTAGSTLSGRQRTAAYR